MIPIERSVIDDSKVSDIEDSSLLVASSALVIVDLLNDPHSPSLSIFSVVNRNQDHGQRL